MDDPVLTALHEVIQELRASVKGVAAGGPLELFQPARQLERALMKQGITHEQALLSLVFAACEGRLILFTK